MSPTDAPGTPRGVPGARPRLRRVEPGTYVTRDGRYAIDRQDLTTECAGNHPTAVSRDRGADGLCEGHAIYLPKWWITDAETGDFVPGLEDYYDTKAAAVEALLRYLAKEGTP